MSGTGFETVHNQQLLGGHCKRGLAFTALMMDLRLPIINNYWEVIVREV